MRLFAVSLLLLLLLAVLCSCAQSSRHITPSGKPSASRLQPRKNCSQFREAYGAKTLVVMTTGGWGESLATIGRAEKLRADLSVSDKYTVHIVGLNFTGAWTPAMSALWAQHAPQVALHVVHDDHLVHPWRPEHVQMYEYSERFHGYSPSLGPVSFAHALMQQDPQLGAVWFIEDDVVTDGSWYDVLSEMDDTRLSCALDFVSAANQDLPLRGPPQRLSKWVQRCELYGPGGPTVASQPVAQGWARVMYSLMFMSRWSRPFMGAVHDGMAAGGRETQRAPVCHMEMLLPWLCKWQLGDWCRRGEIKHSRRGGIWRQGMDESSTASDYKQKFMAATHRIQAGLHCPPDGTEHLPPFARLYHPIKHDSVVGPTCQEVFPLDDVL